MASINGTFRNDSINGTSQSDIITAGLGNDTVLGAGGNDSLFGQENNDRLFGQLGNDTLTGGFGNDTFFYDSREGNDLIQDFARGDKISLTELPSASAIQQIRSVFGNTIEAGDRGVRNVNGDLVIDFAQASSGSIDPFGGSGDLILNNLGSNSLTVGIDVI